MDGSEPLRPAVGRLGWPAIIGLALAHWTAIALWGQALNAMNGVTWDPRLVPGELLRMASAVAISVGGYAVIREGHRLSERAWPLVAAAVALGGAALDAAMAAAIARFVPVLRPEGASGVATFVWEMLFILTPFALWSLIVMVTESGRLVREREARLAAALVAARDGEIRALHYQVNPHFLYNALNSISTLILDGRPLEADRMLMSLAAFFRANLTADPLADVRLAEEIAQQRLYLAIEEARYPGRLKVSVDLPDELANALTPTLILQPLVENAVKHGVHAPGRDTHIGITVTQDGRTLVVRITDDGPGAGGAAGTGMGLQNVRRRLDARFGADAGLEAGPVPGNGFAATLRMPLLQAPADAGRELATSGSS